MVLTWILALSLASVSAAPPHGLGTGGGVGYTDAFRPKFPGVDVPGTGDLYLYKSPPDVLEPNPDKIPIEQKPIGAEDDPDATLVQKPSAFPENPDLHPTGKMQEVPVYQGEAMVRDVVEKPIIEKTIIKQCECEKNIEEKHIEEPFEQQPLDDQYVPAESSYESSVVPAKPDLTVHDSKKDPYDVPVNPDFGQTPEVKPVNKEESPSEPEEKPLKPLIPLPEEPKPEEAILPVEVPANPEMPVEGPVYTEEESKVHTVPHPDYESHDHPMSPVVPDYESPDHPMSPVVPEHGPEYPEKPAAMPETEPELPVDPKPEYETGFPKEPVEIPKTEEVQPEQPLMPVPEEIPMEPIDVPMVPDYPVDSRPIEGPKGTDYEVPLNPEVDVKPEPIEPIEGPVFVIEPEVPVEPQGPLEPIPVQPTLTSVCEDLGLRKFLYLLNKAGYKDMLNRKRPLTLFIPSDDAWQRLPLPVLNRLQRDRGFLRRVLRYHMVDGLELGQARNNYYCPSMQQGTGIFLNTYGKEMYVNGLLTSPSPVRPNNGAVYVIPRVMFPFPAHNLAEAIQTTGTFTRFYTLAAEAGILDRELASVGPYTLFAPTDEAFAKLPAKTLEWLTWDRPALKNLLLKHLVPGTYYSSFAPKEGEGHVRSLNGAELDFKQSLIPGDFTVNDITLCGRDVTTKNGVLHAVEEVLFSKDLVPKPVGRPTLKSIYGYAGRHH